MCSAPQVRSRDSMMELKLLEAPVEAVVGSWQDDWLLDRAAFERRILGWISSLPRQTRLVTELEATDPESIAMRLCLAVESEPVGADLGEELYAAFSAPDSPLLLKRETVAPTKPWSARRARQYRGAWLVRPIVFPGNATLRAHALPLKAADNTLESVASGLLASPGTVLRQIVQPSPSDATSIYAYLVGRESRPPGADDLARFLSDHGPLVECQLYVLSPNEHLTARLDSALRALAPGVIVEAWGGDPGLLRTAAANRDFLRHPEAPEGTVRMPSEEARALLRLPVATSSAFPGMRVVPTQLVRVPTGIRTGDGTTSGIRLGTGLGTAGVLRNVALEIDDLARHVYVPGQTGSGKSTFLRGLANSAAERGEGFLFIDPHGDTVERLVGELPSERLSDVVYIDASDTSHPAPINPFAVSDPLQRDTAIENTVAMFYDLFDPKGQGIVGPRWETWFRMGVATLIAAYGEQASILDVPSLFVNRQFARRCQRAVSDPIVQEFWELEMKQTTDYHKSEILGWFRSKFTTFRMNTVLQRTLGTGGDVLAPTEAMDSSRILLVSLNKGAIGDPVSQLLGYVYLTRFWSAALKRRSGRPFSVFVDEAQTFAKGSLPAMLAEGRKFGLRVVMANQYLAQLPESLQQSIVGNVGNIVALRLGDEDADRLEGRFRPEFDSHGLRRMPNFEAAASVLSGGAVQPSFSLLVDHEATVRIPRKTQLAQRREVARQSRAFLSEAFRAAEADSVAIRAKLDASDPVESTRDRTGSRAPNRALLDEVIKRRAESRARIATDENTDDAQGESSRDAQDEVTGDD